MLRIDQRNFIRALSWASLSVGALSLAPRANAVPVSIPGISTLQDLINTGNAGIIIGDKQFYNFQYTGTTGTNPAPLATQITVLQPDAAIQGFRFSANWSSAGGQNQDSLISYSVHVLDSAPLDFVGPVGLDFDGTATGGPPSGPGLDVSTVTEKVISLDGFTNYGTLNVIDFGPGNPSDIDSTSSTPIAGLRDIRLTKDIQVRSSATSFEAGTATITFVDNTFQQVPEPASIGLLAIAAGGILARRRKID
ncbi:MAG TPA: PEP-CTERM sorting domain-containing protein [Tepidisphaeraceae bacterium]|nr:PEP-CTERM sorting domain-containing protein [Tepidisphaeraceae bacterium]